MLVSLNDHVFSYYTETFAGDQLGDVLEDFYTKLNLPIDTVHMICHSLGAHVCGQAGRSVRKLTGIKIKRITALDPAAPFFETFLFFSH